VRDGTAEEISSELRRTWLERVQEYTTFLARNSAPLLYGFDVEGLTREAAAAAEGSGVIYVRIHDRAGRFLVDTTIEANTVGRPPSKPFAKRATASDTPLVQEGLDFLEVSQPVFFALERVGTVRIGYSLKGLSESIGAVSANVRGRIDTNIEKTTGRAVFLAFAALMATVAAVGLFSHHLSLPLRELARGTERIASGDLTFRATVRGSDEVSELARSFNRMTEDLEHATVSRNYVDNIIKNMMGCLIIAAPDGHIRQVNEGTVTLLGYEHEVLVNLHIGAVFDEGGTQASQRIFEVIDGEGLTNAEAFLRARDGRRIPVLLSGSVIADTDGTVQGIVCVALDITERKKQEEAIKGYVRQLEQNNHVLKLFTDILSHDLLNPANIITHMSAILQQGGTGGKGEELEMIHRNSRKLTQIIKDASDYARLESGETFTRERVNLDALLHDVIERFRPQMAERGMEITFTPHGDATLPAHPRIEDIFTNLLSNCLKYTPEGTHVTLTVQGNEDDWLVTVADSGEGIPDKHKESVFERFERREKEGVKGSGLGLAIAKRLTKLHGGEIWIEDNPGGGCVFNVRLPKKPPEDLGRQPAEDGTGIRAGAGAAPS
jgi:PAS domain S-box-containing protein